MAYSRQKSPYLTHFKKRTALVKKVTVTSTSSPWHASSKDWNTLHSPPMELTSLVLSLSSGYIYSRAMPFTWAYLGYPSSSMILAVKWSHRLWNRSFPALHSRGCIVTDANTIPLLDYESLIVYIAQQPVEKIAIYIATISEVNIYIYGERKLVDRYDNKFSHFKIIFWTDHILDLYPTVLSASADATLNFIPTSVRFKIIITIDTLLFRHLLYWWDNTTNLLWHFLTNIYSYNYNNWITYWLVLHK